MPKESPLVSIITTCYNRERFIAECIESVLDCQYHNYEYIIVDDNSKDRSWDIIQSYASRNPQILATRNSNNLGDYPNRNYALELAKGKYVKFVDADDILYPFAIHFFVHYMERFPEASFALTINSISSSSPLPRYFPPQAAISFHYMKHSIFHEGPTSSFIKRLEFVKSGFFSGRRMIGDFEAWHELSYLGGCVLLPKGSTTFWREHADQEMSFHRSDLSFTAIQHKYSIDWLQNKYQKESIFQEELKASKLLRNRWLFFILRSRGYSTFKAVREEHGITFKFLMTWAINFYLKRFFHRNRD